MNARTASRGCTATRAAKTDRSPFRVRTAGCARVAGAGVWQIPPPMWWNVHFHVMVADGVFVKREGAVWFVPLPAPTAAELATVAGRVAQRFARWLRRRGYLALPSVEEMSNERSPPSAEDTCLQVGLQRGLFSSLDEDEAHGRRDDEARFAVRRTKVNHAEHAGYSLHAGVRLAAHDREGRERLFRYGARPPFALDRFSELPDGRIAYRLKVPNRRGHTHRVMTPVECLVRLAALVPPPWQPLVRYHGVFAPNSRWRTHVVPAPSTRRAPRPACSRAAAQRSLFSRRGPGTKKAEAAAREPRTALGQLGVSSPSRLDWARLLARTFAVDALECPRCGGRLRLVAVVTAAPSVAAVLGARNGSVHIRRARPPPEQMRLPLG